MMIRKGKVYMTVSEYAQHRRAERVTIWEWLSKEHIQREADGLIDVARADAMLKARQDAAPPSKGYRPPETPPVTLDELARRAAKRELTGQARRVRAKKKKARRYKKQAKIRVVRDPDHRTAAPHFDEPREDTAWANPTAGDFANL